MDELEKCYEGIGASHYNMPKEYIKSGKLCAARFKADNNWHRCKIIDVIEEKKVARVLFIELVVDSDKQNNRKSFQLVYTFKAMAVNPMLK